jgi:hypothetical protein
MERGFWRGSLQRQVGGIQTVKPIRTNGPSLHPTLRRRLIASLRSLEARFKSASEAIRQHCPDEQIGDFPSLEGIETLGSGELGVREVFGRLAVKVTEDRAEELLAEADAAERAHAETLRRQNQSPLEARIEKLERALAYQGTEIAKLKGTHTGQLPALPHVSRSEVAQFLGMPSGMGRHAVAGPGGGVRKLGSGAPASDAPIESAFTRRQHPLDVIGGSGRR